MCKLYIAVDGDDAWTGLEPDARGIAGNGPIRTLARARDLIREKRAADGLPEGGITVFLREGCYFLDAPFTLEQEDSGTEKAPIAKSLPLAASRLSRTLLFRRSSSGCIRASHAGILTHRSSP